MVYTELVFDYKQELKGILVNPNFTQDAAKSIANVELQRINEMKTKLNENKASISFGELIEAEVIGINYAGVIINKHPVSDLHDSNRNNKWYFELGSNVNEK